MVGNEGIEIREEGSGYFGFDHGPEWGDDFN
jgi:hypothetical protein